MTTEIESAALAWASARVRALELKWLRAAERCEHASAPESDTGWPGEPECWRGPFDNGSGGLRMYEQSEWCEPCRRRQVIHVQYQEAMKARGAAQRKLASICAKTQQRPRL